MSHLMGSTANFEAYEKIESVGVGAVVTYHTRIGNQRQGRTTFPALVLSQHPDDGSVDLLIFYEPEDILWERRVMRWTEEQPGRCWSPVSNQPSPHGGILAEIAVCQGDIRDFSGQIDDIGHAVFGEYDKPEKSVMEYLADFDVRLTKLEQSQQELADLAFSAPKVPRKGK